MTIKNVKHLNKQHHQFILYSKIRKYDIFKKIIFYFKKQGQLICFLFNNPHNVKSFFHYYIR